MVQQINCIRSKEGENNEVSDSLRGSRLREFVVLSREIWVMTLCALRRDPDGDSRLRLLRSVKTLIVRVWQYLSCFHPLKCCRIHITPLLITEPHATVYAFSCISELLCTCITLRISGAHPINNDFSGRWEQHPRQVLLTGLSTRIDWGRARGIVEGRRIHVCRWHSLHITDGDGRGLGFVATIIFAIWELST